MNYPELKDEILEFRKSKEELEKIIANHDVTCNIVIGIKQQIARSASKPCCHK